MERNYSEDDLRELVNSLNESERHGLVVAGMLPHGKVAHLDPKLTGPDVAKMMEVAREEAEA